MPGKLAAMDELLTPQESAEADRLAAGRGIPVARLMEAAGRAVARAARRFGPCRALVLCGPGNNGGDGYVAARLLAEQGWPVAVAALAPPRPGGDAEAASRRWHGPTVPLSAAEAGRADLVVDALFGAGLTRPLPDEAADALAAGRRVLAVDVPSGLDGGTGQALGRVRAADLTVTFFRRKPGHLLLPGRDLCGEALLADIGLPAAVLDAIPVRAWRNGPARWRLPRLDRESHKYTRGHATVLGGPAMTGAARLAAAGARGVGAGLVTIAAEGAGNIYRASVAAGVIVSDAPLDELLQDDRRRAWVCGPGLGQERARAELPKLVAAGRQVVADADALGAHAGDPEALRGCAVLTPHAGEFAKLFGPVGGDRLAAVRGAARRVDAVVLLKGADTCVADPDGRVLVNDSAPPWLATAGAGDVLAGMVAGLLAQGMDPWAAAGAAAWLHGCAAALHGPGLLAEALAPMLPRALAEAGGVAL